MAPSSPKKYLSDLITSTVFVPATAEHIVSSGTAETKTDGWLMDFRRILMQSDALQACSSLFQESFPVSAYPHVQICGLEVAAIPLVTGIATHAARDGRQMNAFFIRKSRKKDGLMRMVEGVVQSSAPIVLVDDILNSGKSFIRQIEVLEELGHTVAAVWCILRFRDSEYYEYFRKKNIAVYSLFTLDDFVDALPVKNLAQKEAKLPFPAPLKQVWKFKPEGANLAYVNPKSRPCIDDSRVYFGTDSGYFYALNQHDGSVVWRYKVGYHAKGKSIFSSPVLGQSVRSLASYKKPDTVFFGAYDGNVYALDTATGSRRWVNFEADWVGSSPALAPELGLLFIGTEFGLVKKRGGIMALDMHTGKKVWGVEMPAYTHSSPLYIPSTLLSPATVLIGSNDGVTRLFNAKKGTLIWEFATGAPTEQEISAGFSAYDIKDSFAYSASKNAVYFGNNTGDFFALNKKTGEKLWAAKAEFAFWSRPALYANNVTQVEKIIASSLDKHVYCWDAATGKEIWRWHAGARVFCAPYVWNYNGVDVVLVGANTGRLTALDPETGKEIWFITVPERIVNAPVYNPATQSLFLPTFANELYKFELK